MSLRSLRSRCSLTIFAFLLLVSCGPSRTEPRVGSVPAFGGRRVSGSPATPGLVAELAGTKLRVFLVAGALPRGLDGDASAAQLLEALVRLVADRLGLEAVIVSGSLDPGQPLPEADLIAGFLAPGPQLRAKTLTLPFFPLPGAMPAGPAVAWWLCPGNRPRLAAAAASELSAERSNGELNRCINEVLGAGSAEHYYAAIGYDGILRAQYLSLSPQQSAWLAERRAGSGRLRAAVREGGLYAFVPQTDGSVKGFDFDLVVTLAASLGLRLDLSVQKDVTSFFTHDGRMPADLGSRDYDFTPDLLKKVDLYANPMGVTAWRERLMKMITIYPIRNQMAGRKGEELASIKKLDGKRFAVVKDSVQQKTLQDFAAKNDIHLSFVYDTNEDRLFGLVRANKADYILDGSVIFALKSDEIKDFGLSPFFSDLQGVAWAVKKDDAVFASLVEGYFNAARDSGLLPALWTKTFKMDFKAYIDAMTAAAETGSN